MREGEGKEWGILVLCIERRSCSIIDHASSRIGVLFLLEQANSRGPSLLPALPKVVQNIFTYFICLNPHVLRPIPIS